MKRTIILLLLFVCLLAGCAAPGSTGTTTRPDVTETTFSVVATVFPAYDWARQIIGADNERVALTLLLDKGADLHSYQPTVEDIYKISTCDLFVYVGGESDKWVPDALAQSANPNRRVLCLMDALGSAAREEEALEGMEDHEDHDEDHAHEGPEYDEHIWLSLRNASLLCAHIRDALIALDPADSEGYRSRCQAYDEKLTALERAYAAVVSGAARRTLLFADRFPFRYLAEDYDLTCYAAFSGCSAETEASFETVNFLVNKLNELDLPCVMKIEGSKSSLAETIIAESRNKNAQVLTLDSLQSVTARRVEEGATYLGIMEANLEVLKQALN